MSNWLSLIYNNIETINYSGVISNFGTAHSPVLSLSNIEFGSLNNAKQKQTQYYSFSSKNIDKLMEILVKSHDALLGYDLETECPNFDSFVETFSNAINDSCKL